MGQGNAATYLQMAGDILNQRVDDLSAVLPDTDQTLPACSSAASRTTYTYGNALIAAAGRLRERILDHAAVMLMAGGREDFDLVPGAARHLSTGRDISLDRLAAAMPHESRVSTHYWRAPTAKDKLDVELTAALGIPHTIFSYATHLARIEVDELTGRIDVLDYLAATDAGRVLNPQLYEQQVQGGIVQGLGYALCEDYMVDEGRGLTPNLATYILPTAVDAPDMVSEPVETLEATGPCGMKGVGEIPINGPLPAVANAVADACGVRTFRAPLTPERILEALDAAEREAHGDPL
jgi:CO/xanthine dehydrogenase Mo-binding subunit